MTHRVRFLSPLLLPVLSLMLLSPAALAGVDAVVVVESDSLNAGELAAFQASLVEEIGSLKLSVLPLDQVGTYIEAVSGDGKCNQITPDCLLELGKIAVAKRAAYIRVFNLEGEGLAIETFSVDVTSENPRPATSVRMRLPNNTLLDKEMRKRQMHRLAVKFFAPERVGPLVLVVTPDDASVVVDGQDIHPMDTTKENGTVRVSLKATEGFHDVFVASQGHISQNVVVEVGSEDAMRIALKANGSSLLGIVGLGVVAAGAGVVAASVIPLALHFARVSSTEHTSLEAVENEAFVYEVATYAVAGTGLAVMALGGALVGLDALGGE